jgi:hypothetical protein
VSLSSPAAWRHTPGVLAAACTASRWATLSPVFSVPRCPMSSAGEDGGTQRAVSVCVSRSVPLTSLATAASLEDPGQVDLAVTLAADEVSGRTELPSSNIRA